MKKLFPLILALIGIGGGVAAGLALRPPVADSDEAIECVPIEDMTAVKKELPPEPGDNSEYVKLNNQFVIPVIEDQRVAALVVIALSLEVPSGNAEIIYAREPKLRDVYLQVLFDHANMGGFSGAFTSARTLDVLRRSLQDVSHQAVGDLVTDVLITEIARQDL